jgi:hypothetical protein
MPAVHQQFPGEMGDALQASREILGEPTRRTLLDAIHRTQEIAARAEPLTPEAVTAAVEQGFIRAVSNPALWAAAYAAAQKSAQAEAGGWVLGGVKALLRRMGWLMVLGAAIYAVGGWAGLLGYLKLGRT